MKKLFVVLAAVLLMVISGCSSGGGDGVVTIERKASINLDPSLEKDMTSAVSNLAVSGQISELDNLGYPSELSWNVTPSANKGTLSITQNGTWSGSIPLTPGDNDIEFSIPGTSIKETITVTYNPDYIFQGKLIMSPDIAYKNESRQITATISLTDSKTDPADIKLVKISSTGNEVVATLTDDGNLTNGDEIQGDKIYTARFNINEAAEGVLKFRVVVGYLNSEEVANSEKYSLLIAEHLSDEQLNTIIEKHNTYQAQIEQAASANTTIDTILSELQKDSTVAQAGKSEDGLGIWVVYQCGISGVLYTPSAGSKGSPDRLSSRPKMKNSLPGRLVQYSPYNSFNKKAIHAVNYHAKASVVNGKNVVKSNKVLAIAAQYFDWGENDDVPEIVKLLQNDSCLKVKYVTYGSKGTGTVEDFKSLGDYGIVLISSHGDSFYKGLLSLWQDKFGWNGPFGQVVVHSNMKVTDANKVTYEDDLKKGRLVLWYGNYGMTPSFFKTYSGKLPNSLVYMSICRGTWDGSLANALISNGAGSFLGYSDYVAVSFTKQCGIPLFTKLLESGKTMADAFISGLKETDADPAEFKLYGANDLSIEINGLQDGNFESGSITQSWTVAGDARIITDLGSAVPTEGNYMAIISTGLGFTTSSGTLSQEFCLGDKSKISFDWNFFSEEFMEWVGSKYQDSFTVTLSEVDNATNTVTLLNKTIDGLAGEVSKVSNSFDQGDVYATGWRTADVVIPESLRNKCVKLQFYATDIGDSIFDTAVLIDNIQITKP